MAFLGFPVDGKMEVIKMKRQRKKEIDTLIISDLHLGVPVSRPEQTIEAIKKYNFKRLILLGDIFDDLNFERLKHEHWEFLSFIREFSDPKRNVEVIWVVGNHDFLLLNMKFLIGIPLRKEFRWTYERKTYFAIHGHQFDRFLVENPILSKIASFIYFWIQKIDSSQRFSRYLKRKSKGWLRLSEKVAKSGVKYAKLKGADFVFCGHTHQALHETIDGVQYFNSGCWTDKPSTYITIGEDGVNLHNVR
ncbi:MAG: UDP-2,3-diacylglucosamine diphosphatase [Candidatus Paceibacterota bacterium]|jgi:UDP-2,3-diacylglucosamine pyrophosphatase LpxH